MSRLFSYLLARTLLWQFEHILHFFHLLSSHAIGLRTHSTSTHIDVGSLAEHIGLVEGIHDVCTNGDALHEGAPPAHV